MSPLVTYNNINDRGTGHLQNQEGFIKMSTIYVNKETNHLDETVFGIYQELESGELFRIGDADYELDEETGEVIEIGGYADQRYVHGRDIKELADSIKAKMGADWIAFLEGNEMDIKQETIKAWQGEGWYQICWSDGGQKWDAVWFENDEDLEENLASAYESATETHLPYIEYMGEGDEPEEQ